MQTQGTETHNRLNCRESLREKINRNDCNFLHVVPTNAFVPTGGHGSSLEGQTDSEGVINQKTTYKEDRALLLNAHTPMTPVSFNEYLLYPFRKCLESEATFFCDVR